MLLHLQCTYLYRTPLENPTISKTVEQTIDLRCLYGHRHFVMCMNRSPCATKYDHQSKASNAESSMDNWWLKRAKRLDQFAIKTKIR